MLLVEIHIILCLIYTIIKVTDKRKKADTFPAIIVFLLPVFGFIMWLGDVLLHKVKFFLPKEIGLEKMKVTDARYQRLLTGSDMDVDEMVPLEDALIINDSKLRRSLLLDILHKNPEEYLNILERAKTSDDVEVTHYATTTLLEIQSDFEQRLQEFQKLYPEKKDNREFLREYRDCLKKYVDSGLIDGTLLTVQRENLLEVLNTLTQMENASREDGFLYIETALDLKRFPDAKRILDKTEKERKESETWNKLAVRYYWETSQKEEIDRILQEMKDSNMYLSREGKEWFKFWSKGRLYEKDSSK